MPWLKTFAPWACEFLCAIDVLEVGGSRAEHGDTGSEVTELIIRGRFSQFAYCYCLLQRAVKDALVWDVVRGGYDHR